VKVIVLAPATGLTKIADPKTKPGLPETLRRSSISGCLTKRGVYHNYDATDRAGVVAANAV
jgi:hypothetical protein